MAEEAAPMIEIDDPVAAARAEWKSEIRPAHRLLVERPWQLVFGLLFDTGPHL